MNVCKWKESDGGNKNHDHTFAFDLLQIRLDLYICIWRRSAASGGASRWRRSPRDGRVRASKLRMTWRRLFLRRGEGKKSRRETCLKRITEKERRTLRLASFLCCTTSFFLCFSVFLSFFLSFCFWKSRCSNLLDSNAIGSFFSVFYLFRLLFRLFFSFNDKACNRPKRSKVDTHSRSRVSISDSNDKKRKTKLQLFGDGVLPKDCAISLDNNKKGRQKANVVDNCTYIFDIVQMVITAAAAAAAVACSNHRWP